MNVQLRLKCGINGMKKKRVATRRRSTALWGRKQRGLMKRVRPRCCLFGAVVHIFIGSGIALSQGYKAPHLISGVSGHVFSRHFSSPVLNRMINRCGALRKAQKFTQDYHLFSKIRYCISFQRTSLVIRVFPTARHHISKNGDLNPSGLIWWR